MGIKLTKFKDRGKILKATGKRGRNKVTPSRVSADFSTETVQDTVSGERTYNQEFSIQQDSPSDLRRNWKLSRQAKVKRIHHHQTSFTTSAKGTPSGRKHKRRKRPTETKPKTIEQIVLWWHSGKESACKVGNPSLIPGLAVSPGEGNGYLLQYSCLENSMDRRVWRVTVHGVAKIQQYWEINTFNRIIHIDNYLKYKWIKYTNQKTLAGWMKTCAHMNYHLLHHVAWPPKL